MSADVEKFLAHYGVKGMHWGVRREIQRDDTDVVLKKGTEFHNISEGPRDLSGMVYTSHTDADILNYRANLSVMRGTKENPVFENVFTSKVNVKVPSEKKTYEAFKKLYDDNPDEMLRSLAQSRKDMYVSAAFMNRIMKQDRDDIYYKRLAKKGEAWIEKKGELEFVKSLGTESTRNSDLKSKYFADLMKQGYNAILDKNDMTNGYGSEQPLLIFKGGSTLKKKVSIPLSEKDIQNAMNEQLSNTFSSRNKKGTP